jgi:site-specific DNA-cytosine methylase
LEPRTDDVTNTLTSVEKDNRLWNGSTIRRLTPTECERLQGFPDGWTASVSDSQRYKCLGNAVTVNVVQAIMGKIMIE